MAVAGQEADFAMEISRQDIYKEMLSRLTPTGEGRLAQWAEAEAEAGFRCSLNKGLSQPHGRVSGAGTAFHSCPGWG